MKSIKELNKMFEEEDDKILSDKSIANSTASRAMSKETRAKMSLAQKNISDETRARMIAAHQNISKETRAKISAAARNISDETRTKISAANKNRSPEIRAKINAAHEKPCTVDDIKIYPSRKALIEELGQGKKGIHHPNFHYIK